MKEGLDLSRYEPGILAADLDVILCGVNPVTIAAPTSLSTGAVIAVVFSARAVYLSTDSDRRLHE